MEVPQEKIKNKITCDLAIPLGYIGEGKEITILKRFFVFTMFTAASFIIV